MSPCNRYQDVKMPSKIDKPYLLQPLLYSMAFLKVQQQWNIYNNHTRKKSIQ